MEFTYQNQCVALVALRDGSGGVFQTTATAGSREPGQSPVCEAGEGRMQSGLSECSDPVFRSFRARHVPSGIADSRAAGSHVRSILGGGRGFRKESRRWRLRSSPLSRCILSIRLHRPNAHDVPVSVHPFGPRQLRARHR
ncbi:hypothetical protein [Paracidovorax cattleyae]|uniref:hypothetical protein n=1 Tax=Paracidovorax cattleyae TaxID=80868 RepID=UPI001FC94CB3